MSSTYNLHKSILSTLHVLRHKSSQPPYEVLYILTTVPRCIEVETETQKVKKFAVDRRTRI